MWFPPALFDWHAGQMLEQTFSASGKWILWFTQSQTKIFTKVPVLLWQKWRADNRWAELLKNDREIGNDNISEFRILGNWAKE